MNKVEKKEYDQKYRQKHGQRTACLDCGKMRLVLLRNGKPESLRCYPCAMKALALQRFGSSSPVWKGGKTRDKRGYIYVCLNRDACFFSLTKRCCHYVPDLRLVMARHLGRCLHRWELVHHKNGIKDDNRIENLQLVSDDRHKQITVLEERIKFLEKRVTLLEAELTLGGKVNEYQNMPTLRA